MVEVLVDVTVVGCTIVDVLIDTEVEKLVIVMAGCTRVEVLVEVTVVGCTIVEVLINTEVE